MLSKGRGMCIVNMHVHAMSRQTPTMMGIWVRDPSLLPVSRHKGITSITVYEISGWSDVNISMLHPFEAAYGP